MLRLNLLLGFLLFTFTTYGNLLSPGALANAYDHLSEVNKQWASHQYAAPGEQIHFANDIERIKYHLLNVETTLRLHKPHGFTKQALHRRAELLDILHSYAEEKVFPTNHYHNKRRPYFIDNYGVHCAVGYLIAKSGHEVLAQRIKVEYNYSYIREINTEGLTEWAEGHGFTIDELAWIQPGYWPTTQFSSLLGGANGPVYTIKKDNFAGEHLIAGSFDSLGNIPCSNIGFYDYNQFKCFSGGVEGKVNDADFSWNSTSSDDRELFVAGAIDNNGKNYPLAVYLQGNWNFENLPDRQGAEGVLVQAADKKIILVTDHSSEINWREVWFRTTDKQWELKATVFGPVYGIDYGTMVGAFDSAVVYREASKDTVIYTNNVLFAHDEDDKWLGVQGDISDTVYTVKDIAGTTYFGGSCRNSKSTPVFVSRYLNGSLQAIITTNHLQIGGVVYDIEKYDAEEIIFSGYFKNIVFIGTHTKHLATYHLLYDKVNALGFLDSTVYDIELVGSDWVMGGEFDRYGFDHNEGGLNHLAKISKSDVYIPESTQLNPIEIYPNPAKDQLNLRSHNLPKNSSLFITDLLGRRVIELQPVSASAISIDISCLKGGIYILNLETDTGAQEASFIVE